MSNSDRVMASAEALLHRVSAEGRRSAARARQRRMQARLRTAKRMLLATVAIVAVAILWGLVIGPIGQLGFFTAFLAMIAAWFVIVGLSRAPVETVETLVQSDVHQLPARTEAWLQSQRAALPAPAQRLMDGIGLKLEALAPQLAALDPREPAAAEARKLLSVELPDLIQGYARVPQGLRKVERDGPAPDRQLLDGLSVIDDQLARLSADLASGDLTRLATQGRYLELKYKDEGGIAGS